MFCVGHDVQLTLAINNGKSLESLMSAKRFDVALGILAGISGDCGSLGG